MYNYLDASARFRIGGRGTGRVKGGNRTVARAHSTVRHGRFRRGATVFALAVLVTLVVQGPSFGSLALSPRGDEPNRTVGFLQPALTSAPSASLSFAPAPFELASTFWGTTVSPIAPLLPYEAAAVAATPARTVVWPGATMGDAYDPLTNQIWKGAAAAEIAPTSEAAFAEWCRSVGCTPILQVPGEIDDPAIAAQIVNYSENVLGLHPVAWEIGNEPGFWSHWRQPWGSWNTTVPAPNSMEYAWEVHNYTLSMRQVDPTARIIGLPAVGRTPANDEIGKWIAAVISVDGPNISAISIHVYPDPAPTNDTLSEFYATLSPSNSLSVPARVPYLEGLIANLTASCGSCGPIALTFTEIGSAITGRPDADHYSLGFPGAMYMAAQMAQAIDFNLTNVDAFAAVLDTANSWFAISGNARPLFVLQSDILSHLGRDAYPVSFSGGFPGLYGVATRDPSDGNRSDLLVVNTNLSQSVQFAPSFPGAALSEPTAAWSWSNNSTEAPVSNYFPGAPGSYVLPPNSLVLFEQRPSRVVPVQFTESGLANGTRWFLGVGGRESTSASTSISEYLTPGTYRLVPGPGAGTPLARPHERWQAEPPMYVTVGQNGTSVSVPYFLQYSVNLAARPSFGGSVRPDVAWWNAGIPVTLTAAPAPGWVARGWVGGGSGNYTGPNSSVTLIPHGPLNETALFATGYVVNFTETGLPTGALWSVHVGSQVFSGDGRSLLALAANGTHAFTVGPVGRYASLPDQGTFTVEGAPINPIPINFTLAPSGYGVQFEEVGLPQGTNWSVTLGDSSSFSSNPTVSAYSGNGTYAYSVAPVPGYVPAPQGGELLIAGSGARVPISFSAASGNRSGYMVEFAENGLPIGYPWSVRVGDSTISGTGADLALPEPNGSFAYTVGVGSNYTARPYSGSFTVAGRSPAAVAVDFVPAADTDPEFPVVWQESGLPTGTEWSISLRNVTYGSTTSELVLEERHGAYMYNVTPIPGFFGSLDRGGFTVNDSAPAPFPIRFLRASTLWVIARGLPVGAHWAVRIGTASWVAHSSNVDLLVPVGTYTFSVSAPDHFSPDPANGSLLLSGRATNLTIEFTPVHSGSALGIPPIAALAQAATVATVLALSGAVTSALLIRSARRREPDSPPSAFR